MPPSRAEDDGPLDAGPVGAWLAAMKAALRGDAPADVPCDGCTACCTAAQFVPIGPDEVDTLARVPAVLRFPAPGLPTGHVVLPYDEAGRCPMLVDGACSIYEHRPRTCRTYDCRIFAATGVGLDDPGKEAIARRAGRWRFVVESEDDRAVLLSLRETAAAFAEHSEHLPPVRVPRNATERAVFAVESHPGPGGRTKYAHGSRRPADPTEDEPTMPPELDLDELAVRATAAAQDWAPGGVVTDVQALSGGMSSLTFTALVEGGPKAGERIVLKVAPPGLEPVRNRDVARQARLMRALAAAPGVRVPAVHFEDDGNPPEVPPFHAMNVVPGECLEPVLTEPPADVMALVPDRAFAAARMLAALHRVDPVAVGLGAEKRTSLEDEIKRWTRAFETVEERMNRRYLEAEALLFEKMPPALPDAICHGDYRLGNMLCDGGDVTALIDWEIWTLSDPRLDLAWFLFFTPEAEHPMAMNQGPTGMPSAAALLDAYVAESGVEPANLEWFHALIRYKEAAATSLLIKRWLKSSGGEVEIGDWEVSIPKCTAECIERLEGFEPVR